MKVFKVVTKECYCSDQYNDNYNCFEHKYTTFQTNNISWGDTTIWFTDVKGSKIRIPYTSIFYIEEVSSEEV